MREAVRICRSQGHWLHTMVGARELPGRVQRVSRARCAHGRCLPAKTDQLCRASHYRMRKRSMVLPAMAGTRCSGDGDERTLPRACCRKFCNPINSRKSVDESEQIVDRRVGDQCPCRGLRHRDGRCIGVMLGATTPAEAKGHGGGGHGGRSRRARRAWRARACRMSTSVGAAAFMLVCAAEAFTSASASELAGVASAAAITAAGWYGTGRRWYGGRWWAYGVGRCWRMSPIGYVWVCG